MAEKSRIGCPAGQEVRARSREAQHAIGTAADHIRIRFVLSIVLPPADGAQLKDSRNRERPASAAEATHICASHTGLRRRARPGVAGNCREDYVTPVTCTQGRFLK